MTAHAKLSASGSARWLNCPGSVKAEEGFKNTSSSFAQEGTCAHELADICLNSGDSPDKYEGAVIEGVTVDSAMVEHIAGYISYVKSFSGEHFYESRVDFSPWVYEGFGTSDAIVIQKDAVHIIDLKYGQGVSVDAENNSQGMLYALGVYNDYGYLFDEVSEFIIHIYQPRTNNFSEWSISMGDLLKWGEWVKLQADLTLTKDAERIPGDKQCQWCKAKATCPALADFTQKIIMCEFDDLEDLANPDKLDKSQLRKALENKKLIVGWLDAVEKHVSGVLFDGGKFDGFKLVQGRASRKWSDEDSAVAAMLTLKEEKDIYKKSLITAAQAEKLVGKNNYHLISDHIVKLEGKPTLALESDKRKSVDNIIEMFESC
jgi:hypothetical protein